MGTMRRAPRSRGREGKATTATILVLMVPFLYSLPSLLFRWRGDERCWVIAWVAKSVQSPLEVVLSPTHLQLSLESEVSLS